MIFWDFPMFYQIFFSPQVERCAIITYKHGIYELPNNSRLKKCGNIYPMSYCSRPEHITGSNAHETQPRNIEKGGGQAPQGRHPRGARNPPPTMNKPAIPPEYPPPTDWHRHPRWPRPGTPISVWFRYVKKEAGSEIEYLHVSEQISLQYFTFIFGGSSQAC